MDPVLARADLLLYDGQSLVTSPTAGPFPQYVTANYPGKIGRTRAIPGSSWAIRAADATRRVDSQLTAVTGRKTLVEAGGTAEVNFYVANPADGRQAAEDYWKARREAGWDFIIACTVPMSSTFDDNPADLTNRDDLNTFIQNAVGRTVGGTLLLDGFVDFRTEPDLEDWASGAFVNDYPGPDPDVYTHFTEATAELIVAPMVIAKLDEVWAA